MGRPAAGGAVLRRLATDAIAEAAFTELAEAGYARLPMEAGGPARRGTSASRSMRSMRADVAAHWAVRASSSPSGGRPHRNLRAGPRPDRVATRLRIGIGTFRRRSHEALSVGDLTGPQLTALSRLERLGAVTTATLDAAPPLIERLADLF